jgi:hypothetical protein
MREREAWPELSDRDPKCQDPVTLQAPEYGARSMPRAMSGERGAEGAERAEISTRRSRRTVGIYRCSS